MTGDLWGTEAGRAAALSYLDRLESMTAVDDHDMRACITNVRKQVISAPAKEDG